MLLQNLLCCTYLATLLSINNFAAAYPLAQGNASDKHWITAWTAMPQLTEPANLPSGYFNQTPKFFNTTIRQTLKLDIPENVGIDPLLRLRFSNAFGLTPLNISSVSISRPLDNQAGTSAIDETTAQNVTFDAGEAQGVTIPDGSLAVSDPFSLNISGISTYQSKDSVEAGTILSVTIYLAEGQTGEAITSHPGSRIGSYLAQGEQVMAPNLTGAELQTLAHWYFISAVEVMTVKTDTTFVIVGDSITDGRGSDTNLNNRWPDYLFTRLQSLPSTRNIAIANQAAGGNRVLHDGLGPSALSRIDRDVLAQSGVTFALLFEGVNDIGTASPDQESQTAVYNNLVAAYRQIITRVHAKEIPCFGATITPFGNLNTTLQPYSNPMRERTRQALNQWIRTSGEFDAVVDFDIIVRDPSNFTMLDPRYNSGDGLHPNPQGYKAMAAGFPVEVFF